MKQCPSYGKTCSYCTKLHHIEPYCRFKAQGLLPQTNTDNNNSICSMQQNDTNINLSSVTVATISGRATITLGHHLYDQLNRTWKQQHPKAQPFISINASISIEDYVILGFPKPINIRKFSVCLTAMADTGC